MKKIEAIIRKSKFSEVKESLRKVGVEFFYFHDVTGVGNEKKGQVYRGLVFSSGDIQRMCLEIVVNDDFEKVTVDTLIESVRTGEVGDGRIFVSDVNEAYRIRTGEQGSESLR